MSTITITDQTQVRFELREIGIAMFDLAGQPPATGYADGYDVIHIMTNYADWESGEDRVDQARPYTLEIAHAATWEDITPVIDRMMDPRGIEGMTQGFVVLAHDPKRGKR